MYQKLNYKGNYFKQCYLKLNEIRQNNEKKDIDNEIGLYDTINNKFYKKSGTGNLTTGPII